MRKKTKKKYTISFSGLTVEGHIPGGNRGSFGKSPKENSDLNQPKGILFIIADGTGNLSGGKKISRYIINFIIREYFSSTSDIITSALFWAFKYANLRIYQLAQNIPKLQENSTACSALVLSDNLAYIANMGNTVIFKVTDIKIEQLTSGYKNIDGLVNDDSPPNKDSTDTVRNPDDFNALNYTQDVEVDIIEQIPIINGDNFVLCTKGFKEVNKEEIKRIVLNYKPAIACRKLISLARDTGIKDNLTLQIIKVISKPNDKMFDHSGIKKYFAQINLKLLFLFIMTASLLAAGIIYKDAMFEIFNPAPDTATYFPVKKIISHQTDFSGKMLQDAKTYLESGNLDSALVLYNLILKDHPGNTDATAGKEIIRKKIIQKVSEPLSKHDRKGSREYSLEELSINSGEIKTSERIGTIEDDLKNNTPIIRKDTDQKNLAAATPETKTVLPEKVAKGVKSERSSIKFNPSDWIASGLTEKDYKAENNGIAFFSNGKIKKVISPNAMKDINIEAYIKFVDASTGSKAGFIIGYDTTDEEHNIKYLLFTADYKGNFSLINVTDSREEILKSVSLPKGLNYDKKNFKIKLKSLGPWVILYLDDKLLGSWYGKDFIKGRIGFFAEANTTVDFSSLKVSSAFEDNK